MACIGVYPLQPEIPAVGGNEGVGVVVGITPGVRNLKVDDWVIPAYPKLGQVTFLSNEPFPKEDSSLQSLGHINHKPITFLKILGFFWVCVSGTWRTHIVGEESVWCKVPQDVPKEYAATVSVNPCTALRMLEDFVDLHSG